MKAVIERQRIRKAIFLFEDFVLIFVWMWFVCGCY
jgi:hypothetical protein